MRFMSFVTSAQSGPPTPELMEAMHKLADRELKDRPHDRQRRLDAARHGRPVGLMPSTSDLL